MNKRDIVNKLEADKTNLTFLIESKYASDAKIRMQATLDYIESLLERINNRGKV
jgi:hypothetical protein